MPNIHTLAAVKAKYGEKVVETATSFVVNAYGKYQPNISFVLAKDFGGDPLKYRSDAPAREMIAGMGLSFGTSESGVSVLFGDFWLSKARKPHFRPKSSQVASHVIVRADWGGFNHPRTRGRWDAPEGAAYFRRASSNGGGTGYDYYVLPVGYYLVVRDEELDGDAVVTPDFSVRAKAVRASFGKFDRAVADKAAAEAKAKAEAEAASRKAKARFVPRLEALQLRLDALRASDPGTSYDKLELGVTTFNFVWSDELYTKSNVKDAERCVEDWEQEAAERLRLAQARAEFQPQFEAFAARVKALGRSLSFEEREARFNWRSFSYTQEGLGRFATVLEEEEQEAAEKARAAAAAVIKAEAEAEAAALGLPADVRVWHRMGGATNRGCGWVIRPDGSRREADNGPFTIINDGDMVWDQLLPGELVLCYHQADGSDIPHCEVVYRPDVVTREQLIAAKQIEENMGACENAFGLDDRLGKLLERRAAAIEEAMTGLPQALQPEYDWTLEYLTSGSGIQLGAEASTWVNHAEPFPERCEGRDAQVVYELPAADGVLKAVAYYKWGGWNLNLRWREDAEVAPAASDSDEAEQTGATLEDLAARFNGSRS